MRPTNAAPVSVRVMAMAGTGYAVDSHSVITVHAYVPQRDIDILRRLQPIYCRCGTKDRYKGYPWMLRMLTTNACLIYVIVLYIQYKSIVLLYIPHVSV